MHSGGSGVVASSAALVVHRIAGIGRPIPRPSSHGAGVGRNGLRVRTVQRERELGPAPKRRAQSSHSSAAASVASGSRTTFGAASSSPLGLRRAASSRAWASWSK